MPPRVEVAIDVYNSPNHHHGLQSIVIEMAEGNNNNNNNNNDNGIIMEIPLEIDNDDENNQQEPQQEQQRHFDSFHSDDDDENNSILNDDDDENDVETTQNSEDFNSRRRSTMTNNNNETRNQKTVWIKGILGALLLGLLVFLIVDTLSTGYIKNGIDNFLKFMEENPETAFLLFVIVYFLATILFIPGTILTLGAGFIFAATFGISYGMFLATLAVFLGASTGAMAAFLIARYMLRTNVETMAQKYIMLRAIEAALEENGLQIFILLRLSPVIPFNALNYIAGITAVSFHDYSIALAAMLPGTMLYVFLGVSAGSLAEIRTEGSSNRTITIIVMTVGLFFAILAVCLTAQFARRQLESVLESSDQQISHIDTEENNSMEDDSTSNFETNSFTESLSSVCTDGVSSVGNEEHAVELEHGVRSE